MPFLPTQRYASMGICDGNSICMCVYVSVGVCVSHLSFVSQWLNILSKFFYHLIAPSL